MKRKDICKISLIIIISIFMIICTANSFAQEKRGPKTFVQNDDKNNDGRVTKDEFSAPDEVFNWFDKNKDGYIDKNEDGPMWYSASHFIITYDNDMDGKVSQKEMSQSQTVFGMPRSPAFKRFDRNGDGHFELREVPPSGGPPAFITFDGFKQTFDVDRDGKVSKYEVSGFPSLEGLFTGMDKNKDGYVVEREYKPQSPGGKGGEKGPSLSFLAACTTLPESKPGLYVNEEYCFSVTYPEYWEASPRPNHYQWAILYVRPPSMRLPELSVNLPLSGSGKLEDLPIRTAKIWADKFPNSSNHEVVSEKMITLDCGTKAIEFVLTMNFSGTDINTTCVVAEAGDRLIWLESTSFGREQMDINREVTNSLRFYK